MSDPVQVGSTAAGLPLYHWNAANPQLEYFLNPHRENFGIEATSPGPDVFRPQPIPTGMVGIPQGGTPGVIPSPTPPPAGPSPGTPAVPPGTTPPAPTVPPAPGAEPQITAPFQWPDTLMAPTWDLASPFASTFNVPEWQPQAPWLISPDYPVV